MGWCSATGIFDAAVDVALHHTENYMHVAVTNSYKREVIKDMYTKVEWDDWDCQDESKYADILTDIRVELGELERCPDCGSTDYWDNKCWGDCYES